MIGAATVRERRETPNPWISFNDPGTAVDLKQFLWGLLLTA